MKNLKKMLALLLAFVMVFGMVACSNDPETSSTAAPSANNGGNGGNGGGETAAPTPTSNYDKDTPLVVAYNDFSRKFSQFYAETAYDADVADMCGLSLMVVDRLGEPVTKGAIKGVTRSYNGTDYVYSGPADLDGTYDIASGKTIYTISLRQDLKFWDGTPLTARDVLFTYYVYLDPSFVGSSSLSSYDIVGLQNWRTQTSDAVHDKYLEKARQIERDGRGSGYTANENYTEDMYNDYWNWYDDQWKVIVEGIISAVNSEYAVDEYAQLFGEETYAKIGASEGMQIAYAMYIWGFGEDREEDGSFSDTDGIGHWDLVTTFPTVDDFVAVTKARYDNDASAFYERENSGGTSIVEFARLNLISKYGPLDEEMKGQTITSIEGIEMVDDYNIKVTVNGYSAPAIYDILGVIVAPMHYYGDATKWDPDHGKYGFDEGDLSHVIEMTEVPRGAGPYIFEGYKDRVVTFKANPYYYKGQPKIPTVLFKETNSSEVATALIKGEVDCGEMTADRKRFDEVMGANSNKSITGDVITTILTDHLGYGYIGMNAGKICIDDKPGSDESKALRKALATVLAVYRDVAYDSYYGERATVIQYPISNSSWAAPQSSDFDYKVAFSTDAQGNNIYSANMSAKEKYAAAKKAALTWFEAAGYTVEGGVVVAAPSGGKMSFDACITGEGQGNHPSYMVLQMARDTLEEIGIELKITDFSSFDQQTSLVNSGEAEIFCQAWSSGNDPDMYYDRHSDNIPGRGGTDRNQYRIDDPQLDQLIMDARISDDIAFRKATYKQCLDIIIDWAVEIPAYQRKECTVFSTSRINLATLTPDITTFWGWASEIEKLEMN